MPDKDFLSGCQQGNMTIERDEAMEEQRNGEVSTSERIRYVYQFAIYAIEDNLDDFKQDVMNNQGWTEAQANQGYETLKRLIVSLQSQADVLLEDL